ncbi:MAG: hypothetical protein LBE50_03890 [Gallionellaceae bacterium]|jgi:hypothetical protein|nr:hypothetical protein [Gallionellaceae bacterium]
MSLAESNPVVVSDEFIASGQSANGGWSKRQLEILGVDWPPLTGWRKRVAGRSLDATHAHEFLSLKNQHLKKRGGNDD